MISFHKTYKEYDEESNVGAFLNVFKNRELYTHFYDNIKKIKGIIRSKYNLETPEWIKLLYLISKKFTDKEFNSYVINSSPIFYKKSNFVSFIFRHKTIQIENSNGKQELECEDGAFLLFKRGFHRTWRYLAPHYSITFFNSNSVSLRKIYLTSSTRYEYYLLLRDLFLSIREKSISNQCIESGIVTTQNLGGGDFGNVYMGEKDGYKFAVKLARIKNDAIKKPYSYHNSSWYEVNILKDILKPIILNGICPNLPLLIDSFICKHCSVKVRDKESKYQCISLVLELANGTLRNFLQNSPSEEEIYSSLFQVMAGLHAIQLHGQIMNFDVKLDNILYYNVTPGGYWVYIIHGKKFYVPNKGKLFVLNDFGISRSMSPSFQIYKEEKDKTFRLGHRFAMIQNNKFIPIFCEKQVDQNETDIKALNIKWDKGNSSGAQFRLNKKKQKIYDCGIKLSETQIAYLKTCCISKENINFFLYPEIIPPFEFYNDVQDAIRMYIGGKRTTQRGNHKRYNCINDDIYNNIKEYLGKGENMESRVFSNNPNQVLASYFILSFFTNNVDFTNQVDDSEIIQTFIMSK